ncbi:MAG: hypothetical protein AAFP03_19470, partial [Cyanobacteria bacterium J06598_3]
LEPGGQLGPASGLQSSLLLSRFKEHLLLALQVDLESHDSRTPPAHGAVIDPPAGLAGSDRPEILKSSNLVVHGNQLVSPNHLAVVSLVNVPEKVLDPLHRAANLDIDVSIVPHS